MIYPDIADRLKIKPGIIVLQLYNKDMISQDALGEKIQTIKNRDCLVLNVDISLHIEGLYQKYIFNPGQSKALPAAAHTTEAKAEIEVKPIRETVSVSKVILSDPVENNNSIVEEAELAETGGANQTNNKEPSPEFDGEEWSNLVAKIYKLSETHSHIFNRVNKNKWTMVLPASAKILELKPTDLIKCLDAASLIEHDLMGSKTEIIDNKKHIVFNKALSNTFEVLIGSKNIESESDDLLDITNELIEQILRKEGAWVTDQVTEDEHALMIPAYCLKKVIKDNPQISMRKLNRYLSSNSKLKITGEGLKLTKDTDQ